MLPAVVFFFFILFAFLFSFVLFLQVEEVSPHSKSFGSGNKTAVVILQIRSMRPSEESSASQC